jgi:uncharacterized membrane protein
MWTGTSPVPVSPGVGVASSGVALGAAAQPPATSKPTAMRGTQLLIRLIPVYAIVPRVHCTTLVFRGRHVAAKLNPLAVLAR